MGVVKETLKSKRRKELVRESILGKQNVPDEPTVLEKMLSTIRGGVQSVRLDAVSPERIEALERIMEIIMQRYWALDEKKRERQKEELRTILNGAHLFEWSSEQKYQSYRQFDDRLRQVQILNELTRKVDHQCDLRELEMALERLVLRQKMREADLEFIRLAYQCLEVRLALKESGWKSMIFRFAGQRASETIGSLARTS